MFFAATGVIAFVMLLLVTVPQTLSRHARLQVLREHVEEVARLAASVVDGDVHRQLINGEADEATRAEATRPLLRLHRAWPEAKYVYTMASRNGAAWFVLDTAHDPRLAAERNLRASSYMEPFELREEYASDWLEQLEAGRSFVNPEFQHDDYGYFLTGHAPILDSTGRPAGFVGVDFGLDYYLSEERRFRHIETASIVGALLLSLLLGYIYARYHYRQQAELRTHYESSMNDSLTGLLNRRGVNAAVATELARSGGDCHAALLVDIDHFKGINDTHGHAAGDTVLVSLARALRASIGEHDLPARLGGDEFLVVVPDCDIDRARTIAEKLLEAVRDRRNADDLPYSISVGIGVAYAGEGEFDLLYKRADIALYQAKAAGKNQFAVFDPAPAEATPG